MYRVTDFLADFFEDLREQLVQDESRHGNEWLLRTRKGQEQRIYDRYMQYYREYIKKSAPIPWLKIAGLAMIAWIREEHPELFP